ncbi:MAG: hypothetical protein IPG46_05270 [Actinobacteria bacterium]|nr:hypothetical protein [Actinomycetota bacterium]
MTRIVHDLGDADGAMAVEQFGVPGGWSSAPDDPKGDAGTHDEAHTGSGTAGPRQGDEGCHAGDAEHVGDLRAVGPPPLSCRGRNARTNSSTQSLVDSQVHVGIDGNRG